MQQGAGDDQLAFHAAGEPAGRGVALLMEPGEIEAEVDPLPQLAAAEAEQNAVNPQVFPHRQFLVEVVVLRHHADQLLDRRLSRVEVFPAIADPAVVRAEQPGQQVDGGGLAGAVRAEKGEQLPFLDPETDAVDRKGLAVAAAEIADFDFGRHETVNKKGPHPYKCGPCVFKVPKVPLSLFPGEFLRVVRSGRSSGSRIILQAAFPIRYGSVVFGPSSSLTAAGPRGTCTPLPFSTPGGSAGEQSHNCRLLIMKPCGLTRMFPASGGLAGSRFCRT